MRHRVAARIRTMLAIVVLLAGCGADGVVRSDDGTGAVVTPGAVGVFDAKVGDCFSDELPTDQVTQVTNVDAVPCDEPHTNEVFAVFDLPDGEYPGDDEVSRQSEVGDCVNDQGLPVPCAKRHHAEIYRVFELKGDDYPGADKVDARAERRCVKAFEGYVGASYASSSLEAVISTPDEQAWSAGGRRVVCSARDPSGPMKGSVRGSGR